MTRHLLSVSDLSKNEIAQFILQAMKIKKRGRHYRNKLSNKTLVTFFEMPSLRTQLSFQTAISTMGGHYIDYHAENAPWSHGKERIEDVAEVMSRYVNAVMVRMHDHEELETFSRHASIPIINGLTTEEHPCQILSDLLTIKEHFKKLSGLKLTYLGDANNNVTHSLLLGCATMGIHCTIGCPVTKTYMPDSSIISAARKIAKQYHKDSIKLQIVKSAETAVKDADIVYTDSWMSYRIPEKQKAKRLKALKDYKVTQKIMDKANDNAIFMHCLPAQRGIEVTAEVIDGKKSVVFDQAENRLHMQKAILLNFLK